MSNPLTQSCLAGPRYVLATAAILSLTVYHLATAGDEHRNRLREIVQEQCVPHWLQDRDPAPCLSVTLQKRSNSVRGFAVLPDRKGGAHFLLIPIESLDGIESEAARTPGSENYFQAAWAARTALTKVVGHEVRRRAVGLAINSSAARSQDQLHIHIECLGDRAYNAVAANAKRLSNAWAPLDIDGHPYQARRVMGRTLDRANPFELLADGIPGAKAAMQTYTLVVTGMDFRDGPGFVILAGKSVPGGELLLDSSCALVQ